LAYQVASGELAEALQEEVPQTIVLWQVTLAERPTERPYLAVDQQLVEQLIATYQAPDIFNELLSDLEQHPQVHYLMDQAFKSTTLAMLNERMTKNYRFRRDADVD
jgi:hypothetical protein